MTATHTGPPAGHRHVVPISRWNLHGAMEPRSAIYKTRSVRQSLLIKRGLVPDTDRHRYTQTDRQTDTGHNYSTGRVRENVCNSSKNVKSDVFWILKNTLKRKKRTYTFRGHLITAVFSKHYRKSVINIEHLAM